MISLICLMLTVGVVTLCMQRWLELERKIVALEIQVRGLEAVSRYMHEASERVVFMKCYKCGTTDPIFEKNAKSWSCLCSFVPSQKDLK